MPHEKKRQDKDPPPQAETSGPLRDAAAAEKKGERVAKVIARAGLCSRRDAEAWIAEGRVAVNGTVLTLAGDEC